MRKFYLGLPDDEVELEKKFSARSYSFDGRIPTREELIELSRSTSIQEATYALYLAIRKTHRPFIEAVDRAKPDARPMPDVQIGLLPAMFYEDFPEVGGGGEHLLAMAHRSGLQAERVPTSGKGTISGNAKIIADWIRKQTANRIWILALSRSALEFRYAYTELLSDAERSRIELWLNFGGFPNGNALADASLDSWKNRFRSRFIICLFSGLSYEGVQEMTTYHPFWKREFRLLPSTRVLNFPPIPLPSHIQSSLVGRYKRLSRFGPNDGMSCCRDGLFEGAPTYPLWGFDHFCRSPQVSPLFYRILSYAKSLSLPRETGRVSRAPEPSVPAF
jgi:hypothetical protein